MLEDEIKVDMRANLPSSRDAIGFVVVHEIPERLFDLVDFGRPLMLPAFVSDAFKTHTFLAGESRPNAFVFVVKDVRGQLGDDLHVSENFMRI